LELYLDLKIYLITILQNIIKENYILKLWSMDKLKVIYYLNIRIELLWNPLELLIWLMVWIKSIFNRYVF
jgi:hypothetical protein